MNQQQQHREQEVGQPSLEEAVRSLQSGRRQQRRRHCATRRSSIMTMTTTPTTTATVLLVFGMMLLVLSFSATSMVQGQTSEGYETTNNGYADIGNGSSGISSASSAASTSKSSYPISGMYCTSPNNVYTAKVDIYGSELGNYMFEECGDIQNPTITMEVGQTYTFLQKDRSNYYHPLGFAYSAFGDEELQMELANNVAKGNTGCEDTMTCPVPAYYLDDKQMYIYSDDPLIGAYEPLFLRSVHEWSTMGTFRVELKFDLPPETIDYDLFYFCHAHEWMVGRIKLTQNGKLLNPLESPDLGFKYDVPSEFDEMCGTYGLAPFELPNPSCPDRFVCGLEDASEDLKTFSKCIDAMNCHMMSGMTTGVKAQSEVALFLHQMIPHHQNAVNMAKATLKSNKLKCSDLSNSEDPDCILEGILWEIYNNQNMQIQMMYDLLDAYRFPEVDNCEIHVETTEIITKNEFDEAVVTLIEQQSASGGHSQMGLRYWLVLLSISTILIGALCVQ